ncbi:MAG: ATP-dependent helicase [Desulfatiglandaceae bacterium]
MLSGFSFLYEDALNPDQLKAVMTTEGPVLVIAGAGSGKTRTLVYRVYRLIEAGVSPESILLLTFTRKAAGEMLERASTLGDPRCRQVSGGTFHSLAHRILRIHAERLGFGRDFIVLDRADMEEIIHSLIPELRIPKDAFRFPKKSTVAGIISKAANLQRPVEKVVNDDYSQFNDASAAVTRLNGLYQEYKQAHGLMDYDDLIIKFRSLLADHQDIRAELNARYRYVLVDEYQDTNNIQSDIARLLAYEHRNIMVVGDDCQSIYSFRGADYRNMFTFPEVFPETSIIKLEENYRSLQPILAFTNALMSNAGKSYTKCLFSSRTGGERPKIVDTGTSPGQSLFIRRYLETYVKQGGALRDAAVLFRAGYQSFDLEAELTRGRIPYVKYGGFKFLESAHIRDFLAHLRVVVNSGDVVSWGRILRLIKNVGQAKSHSVISWMAESGANPGEIVNWPGLGKKDQGLSALSALLAELTAKNVGPVEAVEKVMAYYVPMMEGRFDDYPRRKNELEQLVPMASRYRSLRSFVDDLLLDPPAGSADLDGGNGTNVLTLSTVHSAKGLEWKVVFIIWAVDGKFPPFMALDDPEAIEEERRLMYVASTRAKDELIICFPGAEGGEPWAARYMRGGIQGLSCFLREVPRSLVSYESIRSGRRGPAPFIPPSARAGMTGKKASWKSGTATPPPVIESYCSGEQVFKAGDMVVHPAFGAGVISRLAGSDKVEVFFKEVGRKLLHLKATSLTKA